MNETGTDEAVESVQEPVPEVTPVGGAEAPKATMRYLSRQRVGDILPGTVVSDKDKIAALEAAGVLGVFFTPIAGDE